MCFDALNPFVTAEHFNQLLTSRRWALSWVSWVGSPNKTRDGWDGELAIRQDHSIHPSAPTVVSLHVQLEQTTGSANPQMALFKSEFLIILNHHNYWFIQKYYIVAIHFIYSITMKGCWEDSKIRLGLHYDAVKAKQIFKLLLGLMTKGGVEGCYVGEQILLMDHQSTCNHLRIYHILL